MFDSQAAKAAEILDPFELDPAKLAPAYRMTFLATQALSLRMSKNAPQIEGFPWNSLQTSERRKFSELIRAGRIEKGNDCRKPRSSVFVSFLAQKMFLTNTSDPDSRLGSPGINQKPAPHHSNLILWYNKRKIPRGVPLS